MFDIGFWEVAFIGVISLLIIGPERLPGAAHRVGLWVGKGRRMLNEVMTDVKKEMKEYEVEQVSTLKDEFKSAKKQLNEVTQSTSDALATSDALDLKATGNEIKKEIKNSVTPSTVTPSAQKIGKTIKKSTTRKTASKKPTTRKKTKPTPIKKTAKKTSKKKAAKKAAESTPNKQSKKATKKK